jgi:hypothetical protein
MSALPSIVRELRGQLESPARGSGSFNLRLTLLHFRVSPRETIRGHEG